MKPAQANFRYVLDIRDLSVSPEIEITESEYLEIAKQRLIIIAGIGFEETYDLLVGNFLEYEKELLDIAADDLVAHGILDHAAMFRLRHRTSRRIVNLLTAARLYVDQLCTRVRNCYPDMSDPNAFVKSLLSNMKAFRWMRCKSALAAKK